jgi:hypothetical protein
MKQRLVTLAFSLITFVGLMAGSAFASSGPMPDPNGPGLSQQVSH